jgi:hypothetical protein
MFSPSFDRFLRLLARAAAGGRRRTTRPRRQGVRPTLEVLEVREVPAVDVWTGADGANVGNHNWSDPKNWSLNSAPTSSDVAEFTGGAKSGTAIIDQNFTLAGLQINGSWGGTIDGNSKVTLALANGSSNVWDSGSLSVDSGFNLVNNGTLTLGGSESLGGNAGTITNNGILNLGGNGLYVFGSGAAPTLDNAAGATLDFTTNSGIFTGGVSNGGLVVNVGLIEKTGGTASSTIFNGYGSLDNTGTVSVATGTLTLGCTSSSTNGTFQVAAGAELELGGPYGVTFTESGTFTAAGAGSIVLDDGVLATGGSGATFNIPGTVTFLWSSGNIDVPSGATLVYNGIFTIDNASGVRMTGGGTFQNNGTVLQEGAGSVSLSGLGSSANVIDNTAGATYDFLTDSSIFQSGYASPGAIVNAGLIEKTGGQGTSYLFAGGGGLGTLSNSGRLEAASGTLALDGSYSTLTNGTYQAAAGATLDLGGGSGGTILQSGTFTGTGAGTIVLDNPTLETGSGTTTFNIPSTLSFQWSSGSIDIPSGATLGYNGNLTLNNSNAVGLGGGGTFQENGTIVQQGTANLRFGSSPSADTLVIPKGSLYDFASNAGIDGSAGLVLNAGTIEKSAGGGASPINVRFSNEGGTLSVATGTLLLDSIGGENTGGTFNVSGGAVLDLTGGNTVNYSGTYTGSGSGEVLLDAGTLNTTGGSNGATFNLPGNLFVWSGGTINTAAGNNFTLLGTMNVTGNGSEAVGGTGTLNIGTSTAAGTLNDTGTGNTLTVQSAGGTLAINAKGKLNIADDTINGNGLLSNLGSLVKTAGTSGATISTPVDNQGKVQVNDGTLLLSGFVVQVFNGVLTGGSWTIASSSTTSSTLDISSASFSTIGIGASVTLTGPNSSFSNLSGLSANQGAFNLSGGASFTTAGSFTNSGSMTLGPGSVLTVKGAFTQTSAGSLVEQVGGTSSSPTFGGIVSTGKVSLDGTLSVTSTVVPAVGSSFEVINNGAGSAISGTFTGLPEGATFTVKVGSTTMTFKISYVGGPGGKNVVLTRVS